MNAADFETGGDMFPGGVGCVAWRRPVSLESVRGGWQPSLIIAMEGGVEDGAFVPPVTLTVFGRERLLMLRQAVDAALGEVPSA